MSAIKSTVLRTDMEVIELGGGDAAIDATVARMARVAKEDAADVNVPDYVRVFVRNLHGMNFKHQLWSWFYNNFAFKPDPTTFELLRRPRYYFGLGPDAWGHAWSYVGSRAIMPPAVRAVRGQTPFEGDCDCLATLMVCLLNIRNSFNPYPPTRPVFCVAGKKPDPKFVHVFPGVLAKPDYALSVDRVTPMDPQEGFPVGVWPTDISRLRIYSA